MRALRPRDDTEIVARAIVKAEGWTWRGRTSVAHNRRQVMAMAQAAIDTVRAIDRDITKTWNAAVLAAHAERERECPGEPIIGLSVSP